MASLRRECLRTMAQATDYQTWFDAALELDRWEGLEDWRQDEISVDYDFELIRARRERLHQRRQQQDVKYLVHHLRQGLHWNLGNTSNPRLYAVARTGTKKLIEDYIEEVCGALNYICDNDFQTLSAEAKLKFFQDTALSFGRSALMLSGGATLGLFHVGVVKAMHEQDLLPAVLSGSSAGAMVASAIGTRSESEYQELLDAGHYYHQFLRRMPYKAAWNQGALMDAGQLRRVLQLILGDHTFETAYEKSGRAINITVSPVSTNQIPRLLNHLTFPHLYVLEAVMASCALPLLFPPAQLATQEVDGTKAVYMPSLKWVDGTLKSDLPSLRLRRLHNVNHYIVSQTNPHVVPFIQHQRAMRKSLWVSSREVILGTVKHQAENVVNLMHRLTPFGIGRSGLKDLQAILEQDYRGNITIVPQFHLRDYWGIVSNPTPRMVDRLILEGERATWPRMAMIRNQTRISQTLDRCVARLKARMNGEQGRPQLRVVR